MIRALAALLAKELQQHGVAIAIGVTLVLAVAVSMVGISLQTGAPTLMQAAGDAVFLGIPPFVLFLSERLIAQERKSGTHAFLDALPLPPVLRFAVPWSIAVLVTMGVTAVIVQGVATVAVLREGVPGPWLRQIHLQTQLYAVASLGMTFAVAHLGSLRVLAWWWFFAAVLVLEGAAFQPTRYALWTGVLMDPLDAARMHVEVTPLVVAAAWAVGAFAAGLFLSAWRDGAVPRRMYRPVTARGFSAQVLAGILVPMAFEVAIDARPPDTAQTWFGVPEVPVEGVEIRVAGTDEHLWEIAELAAHDLSILRVRTRIEPLRPVVLVPGPAVDLEAVRLAPATEEAGGLVLMVDTSEHQGDLVREIVYRILVHHTADRASWNPHLGWLLRGTPAWLRPDPVVEARAAAAHAALDVLPDWLRVELAVGPDVSEGVAWTAIDALGDEKTTRLLARALAAPLRRYDLVTAQQLAPIGPGWVQEITGTDLMPLWREALTARLGLPAPAPELTLHAPAGHVELSFDGALPRGSMVRWRTLDPLSTDPLPTDRIHVIERVAPGARRIALPVSADQQAAAEIIWMDPSLRGYRTSGWGARW